MTVGGSNRNFVLLATATALSFMGCLADGPLTSHPVRMNSSRGSAQRITYELAGVQTATLLASFDSSEARPALLPVSHVEHESRGAALEPAKASQLELSARLDLVESSDGTAWAFLTVPLPHRQVYRLQISDAEMSLALQGLVRDGLFSGQHRPGGGATIEVLLASGAVRKEWTPEPRLDELAERVFTGGEFIASSDDAIAGHARVTAPLPPLPSH